MKLKNGSRRSRPTASTPPTVMMYSWRMEKTPARICNECSSSIAGSITKEEEEKTMAGVERPTHFPVVAPGQIWRRVRKPGH